MLEERKWMHEINVTRQSEDEFHVLFKKLQN